MQYKDNWEDAVRRYEAWWEHEELDRPLMRVSARARPVQGPTVPEDLTSRWLDAEYIIKSHEAAFASRHFAGESFPMAWPNMGPGILGAYVGCDPVFDETTMWVKRLEGDLEDIHPKWDENNEWWQRTVQLIEAITEAGKGRWISGITDLGGAMDVVAGMRHSDQLCIDLIENPEQIERIVRDTTAIWKKAYSALADITQPNNDGTVGWLATFSRGRNYPLQCDFSCMISPDMFEQFVMPELTELCSWLDRAVYHLDGPGAIKHLDMLLGIKELNAIQWVEGAGQPGVLEWVDLIKRILDAGKSVFLHTQASDVEPLLKQIGRRGVAIDCSASSPEEADWLVEQSAQWSNPG